MRTRIVFFLLSLLFLGSVSAQERKGLNTANMSRAIEAYYNNDYAEAFKYFNAELSDNPKNGYAHLWLAYVYSIYEEYGYGISSSNQALRYLPKKDKSYIMAAYYSRASAYEQLGDCDKALSDYNAAVKADPSNAKIYADRGDFLYRQGKYKQSNEDYMKYIGMAPTEPLGYMGVGRNLKEIGEYEKATLLFDQVVKLRGSDYAKGYSFRAECYVALGRFDEAASDIVTAMTIDRDDNKAFYEMQVLADSSYRTIVSRLKVQAAKEPNVFYWPYCLGIISQYTKRYDKAISYYGEALEKDRGDFLYHRIAECYKNMGDYYTALKYCNIAIDMDSINLDYRQTRIAVNYELNDFPAVMKDLDYCIQQNTANTYWYYYRRGWYKELFGDKEGAIEDYTSSITLYPSYPYVYMSRGKVLLEMGEAADARKDLRKCIELDTVDMSRTECASYAYHYLGDDENAARLLDTMLAHEGSAYDAVCMYALMGDHERAISYMRKAFEEGYCKFNHLERDSDLSNIRNDEEFRQLVDQYKKKYAAQHTEDYDATSANGSRTTELPFKRRGGVTEVSCSVNGLPLFFIFDTGAGDLTISSIEAAFMFKNGYLTDKDVIGLKNYRTASGDIVEGTQINIATIKIGDFELNNVRASVVKGQNAPLLLGQSALSRFGKVEIDYDKQVIQITY